MILRNEFVIRENFTTEDNQIQGKKDILLVEKNILIEGENQSLAENCLTCAGNNIKIEGYNQVQAINCLTEAQGNISIGEDNQSLAKNCVVRAGKNINISEDNQPYAINCLTEAEENIYIGEDNQLYAEKCLGMAKKIVAKSHGKGSIGCVLIANEIEGEISERALAVDCKKMNIDEESLERLKDYFIEEYKKLIKNEPNAFDVLCLYKVEPTNLFDFLFPVDGIINFLENKKSEIHKYTGKELEKISEMDLYFLLDNNSREKLRKKIDELNRKKIKYLYNIKNEKIESIKNYLHTLSLKDLIEIGKYMDFVEYDENDAQKLKKIDKEFNSYIFKLEQIIKNPENFKELKIAKKLKKLKGKRIKKRKILKNLIKEIEKKKKARKRDYLINKLKENVKKYASKIGYQGEINEDILFALKLHKRLKEFYEKEAKLLEDLIKGVNPLEYENNKKWIEKMKNKVNIDKWLEGYKKEYIPKIAENYFENIKKEQEKEFEEAKNHLMEYGIEVNSIEEIKTALKQYKNQLPENIYRDVKTHLQRYESLKGVIYSNIPKKIVIEVEKNPLKALQMGEIVGSCLCIGGGNEYSNVTNVVDVNKQIVYVKDENGKIIGRILIGLNNEGEIVGYRLYNLDKRLDLEPYVKDFIHNYAEKIGAKVGIKSSPEALNANWYDDGIKDWR